MISALKRLNRLRESDDPQQLRQNVRAIQDTFSFLLGKRTWIGDRFSFSTTSQSFVDASSVEIKPSGSGLILIGLVIDSADKEVSSGLVDGIAASSSGGINSIIQILRDDKAFARFQVDSGGELSQFFCLDSSPKAGKYEYKLQAKNSGAGTALSITNMKLFALELF